MQQQQQRLLSVAVFTILLLYIDCVVKGSHNILIFLVPFFEIGGVRHFEFVPDSLHLTHGCHLPSLASVLRFL